MAILDSQSVASGPQKGERGVDGHEKIKGIKRHILTRSLGFVPGALVTPATVHDTAAAGMLFDQAALDGWNLQRVKVDGIHTGARMDAAAARHGLDIQLSTRPKEIKQFMPLPLRWRVEATSGTLTSRYRHLTRDLTQSPATAGDGVPLANFHRALKACHREKESID